MPDRFISWVCACDNPAPDETGRCFECDGVILLSEPDPHLMQLIEDAGGNVRTARETRGMKVNEYEIKAYADLTGAGLTGASLTRANLTGADLTGANLSGANLSWAYLSSAVGCYLLPVQDVRGYSWAHALKCGDTWFIRAGCRFFTIEEAKQHWGKSYTGDREQGDMYLYAVDWLEKKLAGKGDKEQ